MANGLNKVFVIGNLGDEPVINTSSTGTCIAHINLAINSTYKDQKTGQLNNETEWVKVTAFGRTAEIMRDYLHKGSTVHIEGKIRTSQYDDKKTGEKRYSTTVVCDNLILLSAKNNENIGNNKPFNQQNNQQFNQQNNQQQFATPQLNQYVNQPINNFQQDVPF